MRDLASQRHGLGVANAWIWRRQRHEVGVDSSEFGEGVSAGGAPPSPIHLLQMGGSVLETNPQGAILISYVVAHRTD